MKEKFIGLTLASNEQQSGNIEIIFNPDYVTHFHKAEQREGDFTDIHFINGQTILVKQSIEEVKKVMGYKSDADKESKPSNLLNQAGYL